MKDLTNHRFGRLVVTGYYDKKGSNHRWLCICDCGNEKVANAGNLQYGGTQSCGCLYKERVTAKNSTHGYCRGVKKHPVYLVWRTMRSRCENPNVAQYAVYGGSGIYVCERWRNGEDGKSGFECFIADMGERPSPMHTVERFVIKARTLHRIASGQHARLKPETAATSTMWKSMAGP